MPKISSLTPIVTPADDDVLPIVDDSATETKKMSLSTLVVWLQNIIGWITTAMIDDNAVTSDKADLSYVHVDGTAFAGSFVITSASAQDTGYSITLPTAGTWLVTAKIRTRLNVNGASGRYIRLWLRQNDVTDIDESICCYHGHETIYHIIHNQPFNVVVVTTGANETVDVWGALSATANVIYGQVESDGNGYSTLTAVRIA